MSRPLSEDLRRRIIEERAERKKTYEELAEQFRVGRASISRVLRLERETGGVAPRPHGGGMPRRISDEELPRLKALVDAHPDATLQELAELAGKELGRSLSRPTLGRAMVRLRLLKKEEGPRRQRALPSQRAGEARGVSRGHRRR